MTTSQKYIIILIIFLAVLTALVNSKHTFSEQPQSIGDPLELIIIKNNEDFNKDFYKQLKDFLSIEINPSPQPEGVLKLIEVNNADFKGILKRHQNLLFLSRADSFSISTHQNVFAEGQEVIYITCPSIEVLIDKRKAIVQLVQVIKNIEMRRMTTAFNDFRNKNLIQKIKQAHDFSITIPKDFFLAYSDSSVTWVRRETPKISQGILIANLTSNTNISPISITIDSILKDHVFGPSENSYMQSEKEASEIKDSVIISDRLALHTQSLWRMENDFMGGIYNAYYFNNNSHPIIIYTYLYAPGERKGIFLIQLESIIKTIAF